MKKTGAVIYFSVFSIIIFIFSQICFYTFTLPDKFYRCENESFSVPTFFGITAEPAADTIPASRTDTGSEKAMLKLYGFIPIKAVEIQSVNAPLLVPSGEPFGLKIMTSGVIVTEFGSVDGVNLKYSPAEKGGIKTGDIITRVNGKEVFSGSDVLNAVQENADATEITLLRGGKELTITLVPEKSRQDGLYKLGMWTRDSCAGIGTITYYDPENNTFGGLGHSVCDADTGQLLPLHSGEIVPVCINEVIKGQNGVPGELCGAFMSQRATGTICMNTECGIFGYADKAETANLCDAVPMAFKQEIKTEAATILATLDGMNPCEYEIVIEKINYNSESAVKNMVIRITDSRLLSDAGGIVQGMSGSPILQNGKLIGAVTHVFVNDIQKGYAIFAENMYDFSKQIDNADYRLSA